MAFSVIFGAGKIARGFIAHLLYLDKHEYIFVEKARPLVDLINERRQYTVNVLGRPERNTVVKGAKALSFEDRDRVVEAISKASVIFTAVGGKNLKEIVPILADGLAARFTSGCRDSLNIITCENWKQPADILQSGIEEAIEGKWLDLFRHTVGITEAVVMRSGIEPDAAALREDPLAVNVSDYWELPLDADRLKGKLPPIEGVKPMKGFNGFLERKFYTYNAANGTVSFLGYLKGYKMLADAAHDEEILDILMGVYDETSRALCAKHHFPLEEQLAFAKTSLNKLQDYNIVDSIERNARDPIRKLGPDDRLVGAARMVMEHGILPVNLATSIAAALYYDNPVDPIALKLKEIRTLKGIDHILTDICRIDPNGRLGLLVKEKAALLREKGWVKEG